MENTKMYQKSKVWLASAKYILKRNSDDEADLQKACFDTQQSIEFILKAILQEEDIEYKKVHRIDYLLDLVDKSGFIFKKHDDLSKLSTTITDWEELTRYGSSVKTMVQTIERVHNIYKSIEEAFINRYKDKSEWLSTYLDKEKNRIKSSEECIKEIIEAIYKGKTLTNSIN